MKMVDIYLFPSAPVPKDVILRPAVPLPPVPIEYHNVVRIKYIKGYAQVKRNGVVVHYCTPYTPFRVPRKIEVVEIEE